MSVELDCTRSCLVTFPPTVYKSSGVDEIVPVLVPVLPKDVQCIQFMSQGKVRISFGSADSATALMEAGLRFNGATLPVKSADARSRLVYLRDCPCEVSDASVRELLAPYGAVRKVAQVPHNKFPRILTGTRRISMSIAKDIPSVLRVKGFDCRVWYPGQPSLCPICRKPGHRVKQCPDHGKCRRCHQPGHVARQCRKAWGVASAVPLAPTATPIVTCESPAPAPATSTEPLSVDMDSCSESEASLLEGDLDVAASAPPGPISPRRTRSMGKARSPEPLVERDCQVVGEPHSAPTPEQGQSSPESMALSPERPDSSLLHSHREVWEDKLQWEEVRSMKHKSGDSAASQESSPAPVPRRPATSIFSKVYVVNRRRADDSAKVSAIISPHRDLRCLQCIWDLVMGDTVALPVLQILLDWREKFGWIERDAPLTMRQRKVLLALVADGSIWFGTEDVLVPPPQL